MFIYNYFSNNNCNGRAAKRSFLKLKIIKNYLRNVIKQELLLVTVILNIEVGEAKVMNIKQVIVNFANLNAREVKLVIY